ncbi:tail fiber protein [Cohnella lubricantis]|uniref:Phage tail protein n=1 Tax=Cohnella lubricantis TaxID=2163172 RepID=A0A841TFY7_9BACL|nr:tail fiber protein [Cohnella lubricantis]MBB6678188.1 phage tail protein [Cohnella lubricantis]MBP2119685.1 microcystin-dependent protein [Cohnella lubricantis]
MEPYVGEIRMFGGNFAPVGWLFCNGQELLVSQYETLFTLIGTTYGGDGQTTFALPNLQGRIPVGQGRSPSTGTSYILGEYGGSENVTLLESQLPAHTHPVAASSQAGEVHSPSNAYWAKGINEYSTGTVDSEMNPGSLSSVGGGQPHNNVMPFTCVSYIISCYGIWPSQQ